MDFKYNFKDWFYYEWDIKTIFKKKNNSYIFLNLDHQKKIVSVHVWIIWQKKIKISQIFMNQNQDGLFKANCHMII